MSNTINNKLKELYNNLILTKSDINEHLPTLYEYALKVEHITEFGVRGGRSTAAWLVAHPKTLLCYDIKLHKTLPLSMYNAYAKQNNINFKFIIANTLQINSTQTDLLFIDTLHTYTQLSLELTKHHSIVNKYIVLHDTVTYGEIGMDKIKPGLLQAITEFLHTYPQWVQIAHFTNNNGLTILQKVTV